MADGPTEPPRDGRDQFVRGLQAYHGGQHYEAHEHWEELWEGENDDDRRRFLQALIQVASAVHKAQNNVGPRGCLRLLDAARAKLKGLPDIYMGLDVAALRLSLAPCRDAISVQLQADGGSHLSEALIPVMLQRVDPPRWLQSAQPAQVPDEARAEWFRKGLQAYDAGEFFDAHEAWEELWRDERDPHEKLFLQGLIQLAAAMHKAVVTRQPAPAGRLLARAMLKLRDYPAVFRGIHVGELVAAAERARPHINALAKGPAPARPDEGAVAAIDIPVPAKTDAATEPPVALAAEFVPPIVRDVTLN